MHSKQVDSLSQQQDDVQSSTYSTMGTGSKENTRAGLKSGKEALGVPMLVASSAYLIALIGSSLEETAGRARHIRGRK